MADTPAAADSGADPADTDTNNPAASNGAQPPTPSVPDDATEDEPLDGSTDPKIVPVTDPVGEHRRGMDRAKVKFGMWLIASCLGVYVILSSVQWALQDVLPDEGPLTTTQDLLKLIATTALGFVFGRTTDNDKKD